MIKVIYPKGSIIGEIGDKRQYCIVDIKDDGYEVIDYPFGVQGKTENRIINYDDVGSLLFWGYMGEEYKEKIIEMYKEEILGDVNE